MDNLAQLLQNQQPEPPITHGAGGFFYRNPVDTFRQGFSSVGREEELDKIKRFIFEQAQQKAQRDQERHLLDMVVKQKDAAEAADIINDEDYRKSKLEGYKGQMQSQQVAGQIAQSLMPAKIRQAQAEAQMSSEAAELQSTINDIDQKLMQGGSADANGNLVPFTPQDKEQMQRIRTNLFDRMKNTAKFAQQKELLNEKLEASKENILLRTQAQIDAAKQKAIAGDKDAVQALLRVYRERVSSGEWTEEQYVQEAAKLYNAKLAAQRPPAQALSQDEAGKGAIVTTPSPSYQPPSAANKKLNSGTTKSGNKFVIEKTGD